MAWAQRPSGLIKMEGRSSAFNGDYLGLIKSGGKL